MKNFHLDEKGKQVVTSQSVNLIWTLISFLKWSKRSQACFLKWTTAMANELAFQTVSATSVGSNVLLLLLLEVTVCYCTIEHTVRAAHTVNLCQTVRSVNTPLGLMPTVALLQRHLAAWLRLRPHATICWLLQQRYWWTFILRAASSWCSTATVHHDALHLMFDGAWGGTAALSRTTQQRVWVLRLDGNQFTSRCSKLIKTETRLHFLDSSWSIMVHQTLLLGNEWINKQRWLRLFKLRQHKYTAHQDLYGIKNISSRRVCIPLLLFVLKACDKVPGLNQQCTLKPPRRLWRRSAGVLPQRLRLRETQSCQTVTNMQSDMCVTAIRSPTVGYLSPTHPPKNHALIPCVLSTSISAGIFHPTCLIPAHSIFIQGCANVPRSQTARDLMFCRPISRSFISLPLRSSYLTLSQLWGFYLFIYLFIVSYYVFYFLEPPAWYLSLLFASHSSHLPQHGRPECQGKHLESKKQGIRVTSWAQTITLFWRREIKWKVSRKKSETFTK